MLQLFIRQFIRAALATTTGAVLLLITCPESIQAFSGGQDYAQQIGDEYMISRDSSQNVYLATCGGRIIIFPPDYGLGPLTGYSHHDRYIMVRHTGLLRTASSPGEGRADNDSQYYFIYDKQADTVRGPMDMADFEAALAELRIGDLRWEQPRNPSLMAPIADTLVMIVLSLFILASKHYYLSLPAAAVIAYLSYRAVRRFRAATRTHSQKP